MNSYKIGTLIKKCYKNRQKIKEFHHLKNNHINKSKKIKIDILLNQKTTLIKYNK